MEIHPANMMNKWREYCEKCRHIPKKSKESGLWKKPVSDKHIYLIVPDVNDPTFSTGIAKEGPLNETQFINQIKELHQKLGAKNYDACIQSMKSNIENVPKNIAIIVTLAFVKVQGNEPMIFGVAHAVHNLFK